MSDRRQTWAARAITVLALAMIIGGLILSGGPGQGRAERRDYQRSADLSQIEAQLLCLARQRGRLVAKVDTTEACPDRPTLADPATGMPYEITAIDGQNLRICAEFETETVARDLGVGPEDSAMPGCRIVRWQAD